MNRIQTTQTAALPETDVLLVEDNDDDALLIQKKIHKGASSDFAEDITVTRARSLAEATEACQRRRFDAVLLDLGLPDSRGIETLERFLEMETDSPVVVLTGLRDSDTALEAIKKGAQDYLVKGDTTSEIIVRTMRYGIERKKNEQLLRRQRNQIEFFNSILRHDMLNELNVVLGQAEQLVGDLEGDRKDRMEDIINWCENITDLTVKTRDILDTLTAGESGELEPVNVANELRDEMGEIEGIRQGVTVTIDCPPDAVVLANDLFPDVVRNLLTNAVEHTKPEPVDIRVTVDDQDRYVRIVVEDDGPGIPDEQKGHVFERGAKGSNSAGTGFGLYFVATMVESYGGEIRVEDNEPTGARFVMELRRA